MERCEFTAGYDITTGNKPIIIKCGEPATWRKTPRIFGGGIYGCNSCWRRWSERYGLEEGKA